MANENQTIIIKRLQKEFKMYNQNTEYYQKIFEEVKKTIKEEQIYTEARKKIMGQIQAEWQSLKCEWLINYLNQSLMIPESLEEALKEWQKCLNRLNKWELSISPEVLQYLLQACPLIEVSLNNIFTKIPKVTESILYSITSDDTLID